MKKLSPLPLFILGMAVIVAGLIFILGFIFEWSEWFTFTNRILVSLILWSLIAALAAVIVLLVTFGIRNRGKTRWTAFLFVAVLLFSSSVFDPATIGVIGVPAGLILLVLSSSKLITLRSATG